MKIQSIQFTQNRRNVYPKISTTNKSVPYKKGLETAGAWFGFGIGLDMVSRKISVFKSPMKNSLFINGILALGAGTYTLAKSFKERN